MPPVAYGNNAKELSVGTGLFRVDGQSVGLLKNNAIFRHNYDDLEFKAGQPLVLYATHTKEIVCELECDYAQINPRNLGLSLGGLEPVVSDGTTPTVISTGAPQLHTLRPLLGQDIEGIKLDGTPSSLVVKSADGVTTFVVGDDYEIGSDGWVYRVEGGDIPSGAVLACSYSHTIPKGSTLPLGKFVARLDNHYCEFLHRRSGDGAMVNFVFHKGQAAGQLEFTMSEDSWNLNKFLFKAIRDDSKPDAPLGYVRWIDAA